MVRRERLLRPVEGPRDGLLPERVLLVAERRVHLGLPGLVLGPVGAKVLDLGPVADREAGGVGRAEGCRLGNLRADDRDAQDVRLELHEQVVEDHAAVDLEGRQRNAGVGVHGVEDLAGLPRGRLEDGTRDVALVDVPGEAGDDAARLVLPVRREETTEGGDEVDATVVLDRGRERLDVGRLLDHPEVVAEPLHQGAGDRDGPLQGVHGRLVADLVAQGREEAVLRRNCLRAGVEEHEAARAVRVLRLAGGETRLAEERGLLVAEIARDGNPGEAKNTYGTGCFMLLNTGTKAVPSKNGLLTTLGYKIGSQPAVYALEGSIAITGALVQWLRDNLGMIEKSTDIEALAATVEDNGGVYFVPAFSGLFAPYWKNEARGVIAGLTRYVNKGHIARAVLEATAWQTREVLDAMNADSGVPLTALKVDGGMVYNDLLMQFQSDVLNVPVIRPKVAETTALGAAYAAGLAVGYWAEVEDLRANWAKDKTWEPKMDAALRDKEYKLWKKAVTRTFDWAE